MNPAHLHLMLVHFPIASAFLALPLLGYALLRRGEPGATGAAALVLAIGGAGAVAANRTGEGAEEVVEGVAGVSEANIEEHEERAEVATILAVVTGIVGLGAAGLALTGRGKLATGALGLALVADAATAGAMAWTGNAGGLIRHPEIGDGTPESAAANSRGERGEDDDD